MASRPLCLVLSTEQYRALTARPDASEVEFFKLFSQLQLDPIDDGDDASYAIRYCGQDVGIQEALRQAVKDLHNQKTKSRKRARLTSELEEERAQAGPSSTVGHSQDANRMAMVPFEGTRHGIGVGAGSRQSAAPRCLAMDSYRPSVVNNYYRPSTTSSYCPLEKAAPAILPAVPGPDVASIAHSHPGIPAERLAQLTITNGRLSPIYDCHKLWFDQLLSKGYDKEFLYNKLYPCKQESHPKGCQNSNCPRQHGIEVILFVTTAALIKWGFENHRTMRRALQDPADFGVPEIANVCIAWSLRNLLGNASYGKCEEGPPKCVTRPVHVQSLGFDPYSAQMYHSFWLLEEWCHRLFTRIPPLARTGALKKSMLALGFTDSEVHATASLRPTHSPPLQIEPPRGPRAAQPYYENTAGTGANREQLAPIRVSGFPTLAGAGRSSAMNRLGNAAEKHPWWAGVDTQRNAAQRQPVDERMTEGRLIDWQPTSSSSHGGSGNGRKSSQGTRAVTLPHRSSVSRMGPADDYLNRMIDAVAEETKEDGEIEEVQPMTIKQQPRSGGSLSPPAMTGTRFISSTFKRAMKSNN